MKMTRIVGTIVKSHVFRVFEFSLYLGKCGFLPRVGLGCGLGHCWHVCQVYSGLRGNLRCELEKGRHKTRFKEHG